MPTLPDSTGSNRTEPVDWKVVSQDMSLSFAAIGLYLLFASYPARLFQFRELCDSCTDSDVTVMDTLVELIEADLVERRNGAYAIAGGNA